MNNAISLVQAIFNPRAYSDAIQEQVKSKLLLFGLIMSFVVAVPLVFLVDNQWATFIRPATQLQANFSTVFSRGSLATTVVQKPVS